MKKQQTKKSGVIKSRGKSKPFVVLDAIKHKQFNKPNKLLILEKLKFSKGGCEQLRFTYSIKGRKSRLAPMMPVRDFIAIVQKVAKKWGI